MSEITIAWSSIALLIVGPIFRRLQFPKFAQDQTDGTRGKPCLHKGSVRKKTLAVFFISLTAIKPLVVWTKPGFKSMLSWAKTYANRRARNEHNSLGEGMHFQFQ